VPGVRGAPRPLRKKMGRAVKDALPARARVTVAA
jgi:hypothetical protein